MSNFEMKSYDESNFHTYCDVVAEKDKRLAAVIAKHGYPEFWHREPGFACLVRIVLEQQVSLASGKSALDRLEAGVGEITPQSILERSEAQIRECGITRQKAAYVRNLAQAVAEGLDVDGLALLPDKEVAAKLTAIKGIGAWTVNVYLLAALHRLDVFPTGDLALVNSMKSLGFIRKSSGKEAVERAAGKFKPYRSIFALLLWHSYLSEKGGVMP